MELRHQIQLPPRFTLPVISFSHFLFHPANTRRFGGFATMGIDWVDKAGEMGAKWEDRNNGPPRNAMRRDLRPQIQLPPAPALSQFSFSHSLFHPTNKERFGGFGTMGIGRSGR